MVSVYTICKNCSLFVSDTHVADLYFGEILSFHVDNVVALSFGQGTRIFKILTIILIFETS